MLGRSLGIPAERDFSPAKQSAGKMLDFPANLVCKDEASRGKSTWNLDPFKFIVEGGGEEGHC